MNIENGRDFYLSLKLKDESVENKIAENLNEIISKHKEKIAFINELKPTLINFAKAHPKATENAITGAILGGGSELVMPANQQGTNIKEIAKRSLLGGVMGGVGGEIKTHVRNKLSPITKAAEEKEAKLKEVAKSVGHFAKTNPFTTGLGIHGAVGGGIDGYKGKGLGKKKNERTTTDKIKHTAQGVAIGGVGGALKGSLLDFPLNLARGLHSSGGTIVTGGGKMPNNSFKRVIKNPKKIKKEPGALSPKGKVIPLPVGRKPKKSPIPKSDKSPKGTIVKFPEPPEKLAAIMPKLMQTAGKLFTKSPTAGGAALGVAGGLGANALSGEDHALGSMAIAGTLGALGGRKILAQGLKKTNPLLGKNFAQGARSELSAVRNSKGTIPIDLKKAPSMSSAPNLNELVQSSGVQNVGPSLKPQGQPINMNGPVKPQEIDWSQKLPKLAAKLILINSEKL